MKIVNVMYPRILIERIKPDEKTASGIVLSNINPKETLQGNVLLVYGPECVVQPGQRVAYEQYEGEPVDKTLTDGKDCLIIEEKKLTAIIYE